MPESVITTKLPARPTGAKAATKHDPTDGPVHVHWRPPELAVAQKLGSTPSRGMPIFTSMTTVAEVSEFAGQLAELLKQVQAGGEVLLTQGNKQVAKLVPASEQQTGSGAPLQIRSLKGHRVLTPVFSQAELAEEMFRKQN